MATFYRFVPREYAADALAKGLVSHNGSAMWIFLLSEDYRPGRRTVKGRVLIAYDIDDTGTTNITTKRLKNFEDDDFKGENGHPNEVIVKNNEPGAYGLGRGRQVFTNWHTTTRYARRREVAKALDVSEFATVMDDYRPPGGWH